MIEQTFDIHSFIRAEQRTPRGTPWPVLNPFNLRFPGLRLTSEYAKAISGTGIYLISFGTEVVYLGKYQPTSGKIIGDRWGRHLQTITGRGLNIGLGGTNAQQRLNELLDAVANPELRQVLMTVLEFDPARFRDTGYNTTANRLRFASENWNHFGAAPPEAILNNLSFWLLRTRPASDSLQAKREISAVEKLVLELYFPCCNKEYRESAHQGLRRKNSVANIIKAVRNAMMAVTQADATDCIRLLG